jgi:hypothetical protein
VKHAVAGEGAGKASATVRGLRKHGRRLLASVSAVASTATMPTVAVPGTASPN